MNKYELALVVSAKIEDDARTAIVEKAKEYITRAGGTVTEVEDWGKKRLAYEVQKMNEGYYYFIDARTAIVEKAKEYITRAGGTVTEVEDWGKKRLAYEVQKMNEGYYYFIQFDAESTVPAAVEQDVRIMDNVLRFLCVRKDEA